MGNIKHTERFAEIERLFGDYFNSHLSPIMRDTQNFLNRKQAEEMAKYSTSFAGIIGSMAAASNPAMDPYQTLKVTGEWNSKTTEDYLDMCKERIAGNKEIQADLAIMATEWRTAVVGEIGRERYDELSGQLGGDLAYAYIEYRIGEQLIDKMVKDRMPKSSAEYIMRKAAQSTLIGLASTLNQSPLTAEIERRGEAAYKPSKLEKGTSTVIGAGIDAITLGGAGSWTSFAKFIGVDLAFTALTSSNGKTGNEMSVEDCISKGVFGSDSNVFDDFRKEAGKIHKEDNPYILATNERLNKKIPMQTFNFGEWMNNTAGQMKMPFDFIADQKKKDERYKDVPMVVAPEYIETYLQEMGLKKDEVPEKNPLAEATEKQENEAAEQPDNTKVPEEAKEEAVAPSEQEKQGEQQDTPTNENGWDKLFSTMGLSGMEDIGQNLGYIFAMLPDILVGMFTGRTQSLNIGDNLLPIASIVAGIFVKNPILKMMMIGLGGANLVNKAGHEALGWKRNENGLDGANRPVQYRTYPDEPLNPRIGNPILQGSNLVATIDRVPCTIQLSEKVVAAYNAGALPLNTLANAVLAKCDQSRAMMERNFEDGERETIVRTRGIQ